MEMFEEMELELIRFDTADILTTSSNNPFDGNAGGESGEHEEPEPVD